MRKPLFYLILLFLTIPFIKSCKKFEIFSVNGKSALSSDITKFQNIYNNKHFEKKLTFSYLDTIKLTWRPNWKRAKEITLTDTLKYIYIPLDGQITTKKNQKDKPIETINTEKYLIIKETPNSTNFHLATYSIVVPTTEIMSKNKEIKQYKNHSIPFKTFTGVLNLKNLIDDQASVFNYNNGLLLKKIEPISKTGSVNQINSYQICTYYLNCIWINNFPTYCGNFYYAETGTVVNNVNSINECYLPPTGYWTDGINPCVPDWTFGGSHITAECITVDDPPPNPPGDNGGDNGNGNSTDPGNPTNQTDTALTNIMRDHCLTDGQLNLLNQTVNDYISGQGDQVSRCIHKAIYLKMKANNKIGFCVDSITYANVAGNGLYNPVSKTLFWKSGLGVGHVPLFGHEYFHAFQDAHYTNGIQQYGNVGFPNIEFEQALFYDLINGSEHATAMGIYAPQEVVDEYRSWLTTITNADEKFPKQFSDFGGWYFHFLGLFYQHSSYQNHGSIDNNLKPNALLSIFSSINCK